ncbi:MAG: Sjogren's syndrome/scleroderma autoantigen 1 family protein [Thermoproteus sp.]
MSTKRDLVVKKIAELVRAGATLTSYTCPVCGTVLVRLKTGEYYCANCERTVVVVKSEEEAQRVSELYTLKEVRQAVFNKILALGRELGGLDGEELYERLKALSMLLDIYEKLSKLGEGK